MPQPLPRADGAESVHLTPNLDLSEDVFPRPAARRAGTAEPPTAVELRRRAAPRRSRAEVELASRSRGRARRRRAAGRAGARVATPRPRSSSRPSRSQAPRRRRRRRARTRADAACAGGAAARRRARRRRRLALAPCDRSPSPSPAASARARARRSTLSSSTARPRSRATRSSTTCSRTNAEVRAAMVGELGEGILGEDGADRPRRAWPRSSSPTEPKLAFLESLLHPLVAAEYLRWREQLARAAEAARGLRHRGAAPLRVGRRNAVRQGRRDHRSGQAARAAPPGSRATTATGACCRTRRRRSGPTTPT